MIKSTMYFGRDIKHAIHTGHLGFEVTHIDWVKFLNQVVDKYYSGYTWFNATGVWKH